MTKLYEANNHTDKKGHGRNRGYMKPTKKQIANIITSCRLLGSIGLLFCPVYSACFYGLYLFCGLTDMVDGKVARHFHMTSTLGQILDPIADKLTQFTLTLCLSIRYPVLRFVLILFVIKEGFQCIAGIANLRRGKILPGALMAGKVCTTILFVSLIVLVLLPDLKPGIVNAIAAIDTAFLFISFINYIFAYYGKNSKIQDF